MTCKYPGCERESKRGVTGFCHRCYMLDWNDRHKRTDPTYRPPAVYRAARAPTQREIGWIAGLLEGEASFDLANGCECIQVSQVDRGPLDRLQRVVGGSIRKQVPRKNQSPYWQWKASGERARGIVMTIYLLMSGRRQARIRQCLSAKKGPIRAARHRHLPHFEIVD